MNGPGELEAWFRAAGTREHDLRRIDALVREAAPGLDRELVPAGADAMLGYGLLPYRTRSSTAATRWPLVALAAQKRHLSLYVCAVEDGRYLPEARADRLGKVSCGRSCVRFTSADRVDLDALAQLVRDAAEGTAQGRNEFFAS